MTCSGGTRLNDPPTGRKIEGDKAVYQTARRQVEVTGSPVVLRDREGNKVQGKRLLYDLESGKVEVKGGGGP
jgi:lipopolysaccharide export system protein LptA